MSTTKAVEAARKAAPWPDSGITPRLAEPNASSERNATSTADSVPLTSPTQPAVGVIRFQNIPRMKVANSGALKKPKRVWRYSMMFWKPEARPAVKIAMTVAPTVARRPIRR